MGDDFYCEQALSGRTQVRKIIETDTVLAFEHTRPAYTVHLVVIPKRHVLSLIDLGDGGDQLLLDVMTVVRQVAAAVKDEHGACRVVTNMGRYQESQHWHVHVLSGEPLPTA
ncbi:HIT family protein [Streptomyces klenkii]|uniref:HIT family protein n=1 Tax=Streptomyces klenkii TaxID=1420899 RepID=UPI0034359752